MLQFSAAVNHLQPLNLFTVVSDFTKLCIFLPNKFNIHYIMNLLN